jgi:hypothetical protein
MTPNPDTVTESYHASGTLSTEVREALTQGRVRLPIQEPAPAVLLQEATA